MKNSFFIGLAITVSILPLLAQNRPATHFVSSADDNGYKFTPIVDLKSTPVKDQAESQTCWCFATASFIESELIRMGKGEYDLSEMYIIRYNYIDRLKDNYQHQGKGNTGPGSLGHDWLRVFQEYGIVPNEAYPGLNYDSPKHNHIELQEFINAVASVPVKLNRESIQYHQIVDDILDTYFGKVPETFTFKSVTYTPKTFAADLGINPDDYVEITSFTHFPYYTQGILDIPDNWTSDRYFNVPVDELIKIMDYSFNNGYTVNWDGDISESGFSRENGYAVIPLNLPYDKGLTTNKVVTEKAAGRAHNGNTQPALTGPGPEADVTQETRQSGFESFATTDDHMMHMTGISEDQYGTKYYKAKNSWGTDRGPCNGYWYLSETYVRAKTISIMVNKNGIPPEIRKKLGF